MQTLSELAVVGIIVTIATLYISDNKANATAESSGLEVRKACRELVKEVYGFTNFNENVLRYCFGDLSKK